MEAADACRVLWPTLRDTENTTATDNGNGMKSGKLLAFRVSNDAPLQMAA